MPLTAPSLDKDIFWQLIEISIALSSERNSARLFEKILDAAQDITHADGGTLYLLKEKAGHQVLEFEILRNNSLDLTLGGSSGRKIPFAPLPLYREDGSPNHNNIATYTALTKKMENIEDAYYAEHLDFSGTKAFDARANYRSKSFLTVPLCNHLNEVIGVLQLVNAKDIHSGETISFSHNLEPIVAALASSAAIALENQILLQDHKNLLDAFIQVIAQAIDAKSSHTSAHCQRVPALTELIAQAACDATDGALKEFSLDEGDWYELRVASWLHDCGKLATPDYLLDKATKLHLLNDGIETVKARFATLIAQTESEYLKIMLLEPTQQDNWQQQLANQLAFLKEECTFIETANKGGEFMSAEAKQRVKDIGQRSYIDHQGQLQRLLTDKEIDFLFIFTNMLQNYLHLIAQVLKNDWHTDATHALAKITDINQDQYDFGRAFFA